MGLVGFGLYKSRRSKAENYFRITKEFMPAARRVQLAVGWLAPKNAAGTKAVIVLAKEKVGLERSCNMRVGSGIPRSRPKDIPKRVLARLIQEAGCRLHKVNLNGPAGWALRRASALTPGDSNIWLWLGYVLEQSGRASEAAEAFRRAIALDPGCGLAHSNLGMLLEASGKEAEAEAAYRRAVEASPNLADAHFLLGRMHQRSKRYSEAETEYRKAVALEPNHALALEGLGAVLSATGRRAEAVASYRSAIRFETRRGYLSHLYQRLGYVLAKSAEGRAEAEVAYLEAIRLDPTTAVTYNMLGDVCGDAGRLSEAEVAYRKAAELNPLEPTTFVQLGSVLGRAGRSAEAMEAYRHAIALKPDYGAAYNNLGVLLEDSGQDAEAEAAYRQAVESSPELPNAHFLLGRMHQRYERFPEAGAEYRHAIALDATYVLALKGLADVLSESGRDAEAIEAYRSAIRFEKDPGALSDLYEQIGSLLVTSKDARDEAEAAFLEAIRQNPRSATAYNGLGSLFYSFGRVDEAEEAYRKAAEFDPLYPNPRKNLGLVYLRRKDLSAAEACFRQVIALAPEFPDAHDGLGLVLEELGRGEEAEIEYRAEILLQPDDDAAYTNLGLLLSNDPSRYSEAESLLRRSIELVPQDGTAYMDLGHLLIRQRRYQEAEPALSTALRLGLGHVRYDLACLGSLQQDADYALKYLRAAAQEPEFDRTLAWHDRDLEWIRSDPRFVEIVGPDPRERNGASES